MAEEVELDTTSWQPINVTVYFTLATSGIFLVVFELARRIPALHAVYDRRRKLEKRTIPPLLPMPFEWLFCSTDTYYTTYADVVYTDTVLRERKRQQAEFAALQSANSSAFVAATAAAGPNNKPPQPPAVAAIKNNTIVPSNNARTVVPAILDQKALSDENSAKGTGAAVADDPHDPHHGAEDHTGTDVEAGGGGSVSHNAGGGSVSQTVVAGKKPAPHAPPPQQRTALVTSANPALTPDVVIVNGRRLHCTVLQQVEDVWTLDDAQLDMYQQELYNLEMETERLFRERYKTILAEQAARTELIRQRKLRLQQQAQRGGAARIPPPPAPAPPTTFGDDDAIDVKRIEAPPRWRYIGFSTIPNSADVVLSVLSFRQQHPQHAATTGGDNGAGGPHRQQSVRVAGTRGLMGMKSLALLRTVSDDQQQDDDDEEEEKTGDSIEEEYKMKNKYLKTVCDKVTRPLSVTDEELLRVIGLDAFVMLRFLRFGFDTTFYPFLIALIMLIPTYHTNNNDDATTDGYFRFTFSRLQYSSRKLWVPYTFAVLFFSYILYRMYIEWEVFVALRSDFIANGDADMNADFIAVAETAAAAATTSTTSSGNNNNNSAKDERRKKAADIEAAQKSILQYRNSCLVEYIPPSHQSDQGLFEFFDAVFPKQVARAEILMKADNLTKLITARQQWIELYENTFAQKFHYNQRHRRLLAQMRRQKGSWRQTLLCRECRGPPAKPTEPLITVSGKCWWRKVEKKLPFIKEAIKDLNQEIEEEYTRITAAKKKVDETVSSRNLLSRAVGRGIQYVTGEEEYTCSTGFVEFKNLSTKQAALQCNMSGTTHFMTSVSAPDPRDINWNNMGEDRSAIMWKLLLCRILLLAGTLFWFFVVSFITSISNLEFVGKYVWVPPTTSRWYGIIEGYLPVLALEFVNYFVPILLRLIATKYIRFKTNSEVDKFVFGWHFLYRLANLIIIIIKNEVLSDLTIDEVRNDTWGAVTRFTEGIAKSSQFFMNTIITTAGSGTMWELAQLENLIIHFFTYRVVTVEAMSKRALEKLEEPDSFDWGDLFPTFIFSFLIATTYATTVPFILGVCALYFYLTTKVYTHQALYVYVQPYEGGGKLMYLLNRTLFIILYFSIFMVGMMLALKEGVYQAPFFFFPMITVTAFCDYLIHTKFVAPSITLNLTNARIIDNEERVRLRHIKKRQRRLPNEDDDDEPVSDEYIFRQPQLNKRMWETKPQPYR